MVRFGHGIFDVYSDGTECFDGNQDNDVQSGEYTYLDKQWQRWHGKISRCLTT